ncbi:MAG: phenylalanine--tRNA ligase subunit alpha, partial [Aestuariivirga sp.]
MSLETLEQDILAQVSAASDEAAIEAVRVAALGKKGAISERMKTLGSMSPDERREAGAALNLLKDRVSEALGVRKAALQEAALEARLAAEKIDVTLPVRPQVSGTVHPVSQVWEEVVQVFGDLGFAVAEG